MKVTKSFTLLAAAGNAAGIANGQSGSQATLGPSGSPKSYGQPNIIFIITDDQDAQLQSLSYTPLTARHLQAKGTTFANHFVTTALCCPSRVSLWTGLQAHNTNVTDVNPPHGGYPKFVARGFNENFLPIWLQNAGYDTYYTGKLFNAHTVENYNDPHVNGFNGSDFLLDPYTYSYLNATYQRNRDPPVSYEGFHTLDVIADKALGFLQDGLDGDRPFFLSVAPVAPHSDLDLSDRSTGNIRMTAPIPLERHKHLFEGVKVPRTENFNPEKVRRFLDRQSIFHNVVSSRAVPAGFDIFHDKTNQSLTITTSSTDRDCVPFKV